MANDKKCVFCGEKLGMFRTPSILCAGTYYLSCKTCENELNGLSEEEQCRRALRLGLAENAEKIEKRLEIITKAEEHRLTCLRCGEKLRFLRPQALDNSPFHDGMFSDTFDVLPAYCPACGKYEFYNPEMVEKDPFLVYLMEKDKKEAEKGL